ncbi:DUF3224 domain-containing protein [Saccharopolyspora hattusasensis]|uniref:DUF3224 domain-containing protein n=1 Tax=Saccharopolyspora hattusasensis TaxID=1128679 RepID=UPI003D972398
MQGREAAGPRGRGAARREAAGREGAFNFAHSATTSRSDRSNGSKEFFTIMPLRGTGELAGITGGGLAVDADGTHWVYELRAASPES